MDMLFKSVFISALVYLQAMADSPYLLSNISEESILHNSKGLARFKKTRKIRNYTEPYSNITTTKIRNEEELEKNVGTKFDTSVILDKRGEKRKTHKEIRDANNIRRQNKILMDPKRFKTKLTTKTRGTYTTPSRMSLAETCDYLAYYCLKAYYTGRVCGRTLYYSYYTFKHYCLLDYVNCIERYELWQIIHMGPCFVVPQLQDFAYYNYEDDTVLLRDYVVDSVDSRLKDHQ